jgi:hypothetical protein
MEGGMLAVMGFLRLDDAIEEYRWLLDRGYPEAGSVSLVGDRHRLSREERHILFRGVSSSEDGRRRRGRVIAPREISPEDTLGVDAHNVLLTVANYIRGVPVFLTDDGVLRDVGGVHGRLHDEALMERAISLVAPCVAALPAGRVYVCFDEPLSHSRRHSNAFERAMAEGYGEEGSRIVRSVHLGPSADELLVALGPSVVATSDSALMDRLSSRPCDVARYVLETAFQPNFSVITSRAAR